MSSRIIFFYFLFLFVCFEITNSHPPLGCAASGSFFAIAYCALGAYDVEGQFYDWEWCDRGCKLSGCDAPLSAGSAKRGVCKRSRIDCMKNALGPASPLDHFYRQHASVSVHPPYYPLQHITTQLSWLPRFPHNID